MAPGGMSLVLSGRMLGGLDVASGTSFSTPYIAGVAALVKQVNPGLSPADVVNRIAAAARPAPMASWRDDPVPGGLLAPTFQQGAGMIDAYAAVHATVVLNVSSLAFNDTAHLKPLSFEICNLGTQAVDVHIAHAPAATVYSFAPGHIKVKAYREDDFVAQNVVDKPASLTFAGSATLDIHLAAGQNYTVTVAAVPPAGLDAARLPLLSGFVNMTTSAGDVLTLPYGIIGEPLVDVHNLDPQKTFLTYDSLWDEFDNGWVPFTNSSQSIVLPQKVPADPTTLYNTSLPGWTFVTVFGSRLLQVHLIRNDTGEDLGQVALLPGSDSGSPAKKVVDTWIRNERSFGQWAGQLLQSDGTTAAAPNGTYRFSIQLLKVSGNPQKPGDFDEVLTDPFRVEMV